MYLEMITPDATVFEGEVESVRVPGIQGTFEMLNHHANIISSLEKGEVRIKTKQEVKKYLVEGGTVEMLNNKVTILAEAILS